MLVECLVGSRAGTICEYPFVVAQAMLADGRARVPRGEPDVEVAIAAEAPERTVRRRGRPKGSKTKRRDNIPA